MYRTRKKEYFDKGARLPKWIINHFTESFDAHEQLLRIVNVSQTGIRMLTGLPRLTKALAKFEKSLDADDEAIRLKKIEANAILAESEIEKDYPVLNSLAVAALWSWLEVLVKDLAIGWIMHKPAAMYIPQIQRMNVKLGDYFQLNRHEQASHIVELLERDLASPLKKGTNRFDSLLEPFGISGPLDEKTTRAIYELQQIRNVIAHRNGKCDRKLKLSCPWLKVKIGDQVPITTKRLHALGEAVGEYGLQLLYRVGDAHGFDARPKE